jgi:hypothetical protein
MMNIDPASDAFAQLPRYQQAQIYRSLGWSLEAIMDEFEIGRDLARRWTSSKQYAARQAYNTANRRKQRAAA